MPADATTAASLAAQRAELEARIAAARAAGKAKRRARAQRPHTPGLFPTSTTTLSPRSEATDDASSAPHRGAAREVVNLVSTAAQAPSATDEAAADEGELRRLKLKDQRRRLREAIQRFTRLSGLRGCGTYVTGELPGLHIGKGAARFSGLQSCHSVWACPVCQARIRAARSLELERAALAWLKAGHGLYMATLTVQHWENVRLANRVKDGHKCAGQRSCTCHCACDLLAPRPGEKRPPCACFCPVELGQLGKIVEAWRGVQGGTWWVGRDVIRDGQPALWGPSWELDPTYVARREHDDQGRRTGPATVWQEGFRDRWGIAGTTRTIEITYGANGWHSHAHVLIWTEEPSTQTRAEALEEELYARWVKRCKAVGLTAPARGEIRPADGKRVGKGVDVTPIEKEKSGPLSKYVAKLQEGGALAMEMTRADLKVARGQKGKTALELAAIAAAGVAEAIELWHEFEFATRGIQCLTWSHGLRERLAQLVELDEREDEEIPEEEVEETPEGPDFLFSKEAWRQSIVPVFGARPDMIHAAEVGGLPGVLDVFERLGLAEGTDYWKPDPLGPVRPPTVDQLRRGQERKRDKRARVAGADAIPLSRTVQQWADIAAKRRATLDAEKKAAAMAAAAVDQDANEAEKAELARAREQFLAARRKVAASHRAELHSALARFRAAEAS